MTSVSIGLPVYNGAASLPAAIDSLLGQTYRDFDILISDNASEDGTRDICERYAARDPRIRYVRQERNLGGTANFDFVFANTSAPLFMWAAHDDTRHPTMLQKAVDRLANQSTFVLAASDIAFVHTEGLRFNRLLTADIESSSVAVRYRSIVRDCGFFALYGLIRRVAITRTRRSSDLGDAASRGIAQDYRIIELCAQGPFAYLPELLLTCQTRPERSQSELAAYLDPTSKPAQKTAFPWLFADLWKIGGRYRLSLSDRLSLQREFMASARAEGTLHNFLLARNYEAKLDAVARRRKLKAFLLDLEQTLFIGPTRSALLQITRDLQHELEKTRSLLYERTARLEQASADLVDRTYRLEQALSDLQTLRGPAQVETMSPTTG